jgi:serine/threonine protein kinase
MSFSGPEDSGLLRDAIRRHERERGEPEATSGPGRFEIHARLGEGSSSVVYRGWDWTLNRPVALKMMRASRWSSPARQARFVQEARTAARLRHPNIVAVYDVAEEGGVLIIVMELVPGRPLKVSEFAPAETLGLLVKAARGIGFAHVRGVVHRDVKPSNILVMPTGEPKVTDFGVAVTGSVDEIGRAHV